MINLWSCLPAQAVLVQQATLVGAKVFKNNSKGYRLIPEAKKDFADSVDNMKKACSSLFSQLRDSAENIADQFINQSENHTNSNPVQGTDFGNATADVCKKANDLATATVQLGISKMWGEDQDMMVPYKSAEEDGFSVVSTDVGEDCDIANLSDVDDDFDNEWAYIKTQEDGSEVIGENADFEIVD